MGIRFLVDGVATGYGRQVLYGAALAFREPLGASMGDWDSPQLASTVRAGAVARGYLQLAFFWAVLGY